jgi:hypothetical protein
MSSLVSSSRLMSVTLPILGALRTKFPKWESSKINPEKVACFSSPNPHHQLTTLSPAIHHKFTTKNHVPTTRFHQNPQQKRTSTTPKKSTAKALPIEAEDLRFPPTRASSPTKENGRRTPPKSQARKVFLDLNGVSFSPMLGRHSEVHRREVSSWNTLPPKTTCLTMPYLVSLENTLLTSRRWNLLV